MKSVAGLGLLLGAACAASAQDIHKCFAGTTVAYQTAPCSDGEVEVAVLAIARTGQAEPGDRRGEAPSLANVSPESGVVPDPSRLRGPATGDASFRAGSIASPRWTPYGRRPISLGMTDDEVLNTRGGGRPTRISRTRDARAWHETWLYVLPDGTARELSFTNGRLRGIDNDTALAAEAPVDRTRLADVAGALPRRIDIR